MLVLLSNTTEGVGLIPIQVTQECFFVQIILDSVNASTYVSLVVDVFLQTKIFHRRDILAHLVYAGPKSY